MNAQIEGQIWLAKHTYKPGPWHRTLKSQDAKSHQVSKMYHKSGLLGLNFLACTSNLHHQVVQDAFIYEYTT